MTDRKSEAVAWSLAVGFVVLAIAGVIDLLRLLGLGQMEIIGVFVVTIVMANLSIYRRMRD